MQLNDLDNIL